MKWRKFLAKKDKERELKEKNLIKPLKYDIGFNGLIDDMVMDRYGWRYRTQLM